MKLTQEQLMKLIVPMLATLADKDIKNKEVIACAMAIVGLIKDA